MDDHAGGKEHVGGKWETINFNGVALYTLVAHKKCFYLIFIINCVIRSNQPKCCKHDCSIREFSSYINYGAIIELHLPLLQIMKNTVVKLISIKLSCNCMLKHVAQLQIDS